MDTNVIDATVIEPDPVRLNVRLPGEPDDGTTVAPGSSGSHHPAWWVGSDRLSSARCRAFPRYRRDGAGRWAGRCLHRRWCSPLAPASRC